MTFSLVASASSDRCVDGSLEHRVSGRYLVRRQREVILRAALLDRSGGLCRSRRQDAGRTTGGDPGTGRHQARRHAEVSLTSRSSDTR